MVFEGVFAGLEGLAGKIGDVSAEASACESVASTCQHVNITVANMNYINHTLYRHIP